MTNDIKKQLRQLSQEKRNEANNYDAARKNGDIVGMRRARKAIEDINNKILALNKKLK
jgi:hypothetical protein